MEPQSPTSATRFAVIACTKAKRSHPAKAVDLYSASPLFRKSREQADGDGLPVLVLSTKYGLIDGQLVIAPYERTFETMTPQDRRDWDALVDAQVDHFCVDRQISEVVFLAGTSYREAVRSRFEGRGVRTSVHPRWRAICDEAFGR